MLVALYTKKMLHNLSCRAMRKNCGGVSFETKFISLSLTVTIWFLNLERTAGKRWLTWNSRILFSAIEEQGLASLRKRIKKFVFFTLILFCYIHSFNWNIGITIFEMSPLKVPVLFLVLQHVLVVLSSVLQSFCLDCKHSDLLLLGIYEQVLQDNCVEFFVVVWFVWVGFLFFCFCLGLSSPKVNNCVF